MQENLVIVESPSKAKTIEKFLGKDYTVKSSFGHVRDLVKKGIGVDIENGYRPKYEVAPDKKKLVSELGEMASKAKCVWLASDEDREGEAIAWHLTQVLGLPTDKTNRIVFHEITKNAILEAIQNPRTVNMDIVNAQQARRILDRLVGFELSPLLWKKVKPSLSAGRVQSVTVRLIVEREREIMAFNSTEYYRINAKFFSDNDESKTLFSAELNHKFATRAEAEEFLAQCTKAEFSVVKSETKPTVRVPAPPFTTSTLQQEAGRKLNLSVSQTMSIAQKLYEEGLITYMRTDSVNLSGLAIATAKQEIIALFGEKYSSPRKYKTKSKGAQEAHEAIRPTYFDRREIEGTPSEKRLYDLIWKRAVASQMAAADIDRTNVTIAVSTSDKLFAAAGETVTFDGFIKLYSESTDDDTESGATATIPALQAGQKVDAESVTATQRFTQAPSRYNEALLVKRLEELGIGRPSTYAPTITTVINRGYVVKQNKEGAKRDYVQLTLKKGKITEKAASERVGKESNRLSPTDIGMLVNDYLEAQFANILDYNFTANVEKEFDKIAEGKMEWPKMIDSFYKNFHAEVENALEAHASSTSQARELGVDPKTGHTVSARIGRFGPMVQTEDAEGKVHYASLKKGQLVASITLDEALELLSLPRTLGQVDGTEVVVSIGKYGPYVRYNGKFISLGKKDDPYTVTLERAAEIIADSKNTTSGSNAPIKSFEGEDIVIKNGRYGAYIASAGKNYKIPRGKHAEELTLEECRQIIASSKK